MGLIAVRNHLFYAIKPLIPRKVQIALRRLLAGRNRLQYRSVWPIDEQAATPPIDWTGWPEGKQFALALIHDVDTIEGVKNSRMLMDVEKKRGFRSCFNFVPEDYYTPPELRLELTGNGFDIGVHGFKHDGKLFSSRRRFLQVIPKINNYIRDWGAKGFSSPSMHHKLQWMHDVKIQYDISTFDTDPFEPQGDGVRTIFPFIVKHADGRSFVELPYTIPQDFTLFVILRENDITIWKKKIDWIAKNGGMALINTHPDYMRGAGERERLGTYPIGLYCAFLDYVASTYGNKFWHVLPHRIAEFWKQPTVEGRCMVHAESI